MMSRTPFARARHALTAAVVIGAMAYSTGSPAQVGAQVGDRAVRIVLPNATGSGVDTITRTAQAALAKALAKYAAIVKKAGVEPQ